MERLMEKLNETKDFILSKIGDEPVAVGVVLGSGLGGLGDQIENAVVIPYKEIPNFPVSTAPGHKSRLIVGNLEGRRIICMQGRFHYYEGYGMDQVVYPIQTMRMLGVRNLLLTNAAGCVNTAWKPGDLMLIKDHIKLVPESPMRGPNCDELGQRFFDMGNAYDKELRIFAKRCASSLGIELREGVYQLFTGPQYETPAEVRFARMCGADAVGMSTVPEAIAASHMRMRTMGISCLTNMAAGILDQPLTTEEVLETGERVKHTFTALVRSIIKGWPL
ncbi:MAG: purine-nucleoside phosphorylase [Sphaerochaetaceae bacterium]